MNDSITIRGIVATDPRHLVTGTGLAITSLRLASPSRRWDRSTASWTNGDTNWFTVTAFRSLASNLHKSLHKGDRVIVTGRLRIRNWEREDRSGMTVEIDADAVGHDLAWGCGTWMRVPRHVADETAPPGEHPRPPEAAGLPAGTALDHAGGVAPGEGMASTSEEHHYVEGVRVDASGVVQEDPVTPFPDDPDPSSEGGADSAEAGRSDPFAPAATGPF